MFSIVLLQYNNPKMTEECIDSIIRNTPVEHEIILTDNGSKDVISEEYKNKVRYVRTENNLMYAGGNNFGAKFAKYDIICLMSNDIIAHTNWYHGASVLKENENIGVVGCKLLYPDERVQHAGVDYVNGYKTDHVYKYENKDDARVNTSRYCPVVTAACIFMRRKDYEQIGGFDENYKNWYEDSDLCLRVRTILNKKIYYDHLSELTHLENITAEHDENIGDKRAHSERLFFSKWLGFLIKDSQERGYL